MNNIYSSTRVRAPATQEWWSNSQMNSTHLHDESALNLTRRVFSEERNHQTKELMKCHRPLKICTFNSRTLNHHHSLHELHLSASSNNLTLVAIQEHRFFHDDQDIKVWELSKEYSLITASATKNSRNASVGGVGLLCQSTYLQAITKITKISSRILQVDFNGNPATTVVSCNAPTNSSEIESANQFYHNLSNTLDNIPLHNILFVCGDFNAKIGPTEGGFTYNRYTNSNGNLLVDLMDNHQLFATNLSFQKPFRRLWTFTYPNGEKAQIDFILARKKWRKSVTNVNALTNTFDTLHSDHRPVIANVQLKLRACSSSKSRATYPDFKKLHDNPELQHDYAISVQNRFSALANTSTVSSNNYHLLEKSCLEAGNNLLPKSRPDKWNNISLKQTVVHARSEMKQATRTGNQSLIKQKKKNLKQAYRQEETKLIEAKTKDLEEKYYHNQHSEAWKVVRELTGTAISKSPLSATIGSPAQDKNNWYNYFSKLLCSSTDQTQSNEPIEKVVDKLPIDVAPFTRVELEIAMKKTKPKSAVGPDYIPLELWKAPQFTDQLLNLCNDTLIRKIKPCDWSKSHIVPIHKKGDKGQPSNYRGISLNSIAAKLYNRMILYRIQPFIDKILSWTQAGYRKSRSTLSIILALRRTIEGVQQKNLPLAMVFVDFTKAFDSINRNQMFKILGAYGIPDQIIDGIKIMYEDNTAAVITPAGLTDYFKITAGIFQGDTLSPFLFIIVIDYILRKSYKQTNDPGITLTPQQGSRQPAVSIKDLSYADDVTLLSHCLKSAEKLLHNLENAAKQVGLKINPNKTEVMTINHPNQSQILSKGNTEIKNTSTFKYLGSYLPDTLTDFKSRKSQAWAAMKKLSKIWKSSILPKLKIRFFQASVESILLYGSETWTVNAITKQKIDGLYTKLLRRALNVRWQDHLTNQQLYRGLPKLSTTVQRRRLNFAGHCMRSQHQPISKLIFWSPQGGSQSRGRQKETYQNVLSADTLLEDPNEIANLMMDKDLWRKMVDQITN